MLRLMYTKETFDEESVNLFLTENAHNIGVHTLKAIIEADKVGNTVAWIAEVKTDVSDDVLMDLSLNKDKWLGWCQGNKQWFIDHEYYEMIGEIDRLIEKLS